MAVLGLMTALGTLLVWWFSRDLKALDTLDFWIGTVGIFVQGMILVVVYAWGMGGIEPAWRETHQGAEMRIPAVYKPVLQYVAPAFLLVVFLLFLAANVFGWNFQLGAGARFAPTGYVTDLVGPGYNPVARGVFAFMVVVTGFVAFLIHLAGLNWKKQNGARTP
jgi:NSS family neurotransmitter:Na+ symporter